VISAVVSALAQGFILAPLALGVFLSYRILRFPDLTVDGSFGTGAVVTAALMIGGMNPVPATLMGMLGGGIAGLCTALLVTHLGIRKLLAGILVMTALYNINAHILGGGSYPFIDEVTLSTYAEAAARALFDTDRMLVFLGMPFSSQNMVWVLFAGAVSVVLLAVLTVFFRTRFGLAMRAAGGNPSAARAVGANVSTMVVSTLVLSNALAALSGAMFAQFFRAAAITDGTGMIVMGLAYVLVGSTLFGQRRFALRLLGAVVGTLLYHLIIAVIVQSGEVQDLKLVAAAVVLCALILPPFMRKMFSRRSPTEAVR
jgi:putative ABC transport system permease protein